MFKAILLMLLSVVIMTACDYKQSEEASNKIIVPITKYATEAIKVTEVIDSCREIPLSLNYGIIGNIKDLVWNEDRIYLIDDQNQLCAIDLSDTIIVCVNYTGQGPGEYIDPTGVTAWGDGCAVTDLGARRLVVYDRELNYIKVVSLPATSLKAIRDKNRLILQNLSLDLWPKKFVVTDTTGVFVGAYIDENPDVAPQFLQPASSLSDGDSIFLFVSPSTILYNINDGIRTYMAFDFGKNGETLTSSGSLNYSKAVLNAATFKIKNVVINSILYNGKRYYSFVSSGNIPIAGTLYEAYGYPFFPRWQGENCLIGHYQSDSSEEKDKLLLFYPRVK